MVGAQSSMCVAFAAVLVLFGCHPKPSLPDYRYRMTVEVETPQGLKSGSSVIEVSSSVASENAFPTPGKVSTQIHGQAVAVDLGRGRVLFALLNKPGLSDGADNYAFDAMYAEPWTGADEYIRRVNEMVRRRDVRVLPPHDPHQDLESYRQPGGDVITQVGPRRTDNLFVNYPMLVTFGNLNDPKSVIGVDPAQLDSAFGPGVRLKRITVTMTDAAVTRGIEKTLAWLPNVQGSLVTHPRDANTGQLVPIGQTELAVQLTDGDFRQGVAP